MQKYSHNSRRVQKELGGDVYAPSGRVDSIEEDVARLKGYEETVVETIVIDVSEKITNLKDAMLSVADWFTNKPPKDWEKVTIQATAAAGTGANFLDGTYNRYNTRGLGFYATDPNPLNYQTLSVNGMYNMVSKAIKTLKADTSTGAIAYASETQLVTNQPLERLTLTFTKGVLKS